MATSTGTTPQSLPWLLQLWRCFSPLVVHWYYSYHHYFHFSHECSWGIDICLLYMVEATVSKQVESAVVCTLGDPAFTARSLVYPCSYFYTTDLHLCGWNCQSLTSCCYFIPHTSDSRKELQRVIVSLFLPLILGKVTAKVKQGQDIDLRELIPDNAALSIMLSEVGAISAVQAGSIIWEIEDPLTWAFYFWPS